MLSKLKQAYEKIQREQPQGFLCSAFIMCHPKELEQQDWQLDFFHNEKIDSYKVTNNNIEQLNKDQDVFKDENVPIQELHLDQIQKNLEEAVQKANEEVRKEQEEANKIIILLQQQEKPIWNLTFLTTTFHMHNIKVDATTGEILEKKKASLLNFKK